MSTTTSPLISAEALAARLADPASAALTVIFDCRFSLMDTQAGEAAWRAGHLPGARYAHLDRDLSGPHRPGAGRHPWPDPATFAGWLRSQGVTPRHRVVAYDGGDSAYAARLWQLVRSIGHRDIAVLDGGLAAWTAAGLPTTDAVEERAVEERAADAGQTQAAPTSYPQPSGDVRLLDAQATQRHLADGGVLIDARGAERYRGEVEPIDRVAGHVPGAINRPYPENLRDGRFKPADELAAEFRALLGGRDPRDVAVMCGSGVTACHHLLAMAHAGLDGAALFTGSWSGWIEDPERPVAVGAGD